MAFQKYNLSHTLHANRKLEVLIIACVAIFTLAGVSAYIFWRHDRAPDPSKWCGPSSPGYSVNISNKYLTKVGDSYRTDMGVSYGPGTFWNYSDGTFAGCVCSVITCFRKCCAKDEILRDGGECAPQRHVVSQVFPSFLEKFGFIDSVRDFTLREVSYDYVYGWNKKCRLRREMNKNKDYVMSDGRIVNILDDNWVVYLDQSQYCWDVLDNSVVILICEEDSVDVGLRRYCMLLSVPFFLLTIAVYLLLPELLNLHGKSLVCHLACLTVTYITMPLNLISEDMASSKTACYVLGFISHFSALAGFFWLNVMCFDVWWMLSGHTSVNNGKSIAAARRRNARFLLYSLYAWGTPLLISTLTISMDFPGIPLDYIKPYFGYRRGWFHDADSLALYFFLPVLVLLCANAIMFAFTGYRLQNLASSCRAIHREDAFRKTPEQERFKILVKLFFSMGLIWFVEMFALFTMDPTFMTVADVFSALQGLIIAYIFLYKKRVLQLLHKRFRREDTSSKTPSTDEQMITVGNTEDTNEKTHISP